MAVTTLGVAIAALATTVAGTVAQGLASKKQADFQSEVVNQQATRAKQVAESNERDFRRNISRALATNRAQAAGAGVDIGSGSSLLAQEDFVAEAELDALRIREGGLLQESRLRQQASLLTSRGKSAALSGFIRGGSQLLTGFAKTGAFGSNSPAVDDSLDPQLFDEG